MIDLSKIGIIPLDDDFTLGVTEAQIVELENHFGHSLPENYKLILKNYNGSGPMEKYFDAIDEETGIPLEYKFSVFYYVDEHKKLPGNIWWVIEDYSSILGPNTLPFAHDGIHQIYYLKWVNETPEIWYFVYLDRDEPETFRVINSFDELLGALYNAE